MRTIIFMNRTSYNLIALINFKNYDLNNLNYEYYKYY